MVLKKMGSLNLLLCILLLALTTACGKKKTNEALYKESTASSLAFYKTKDTLYGPKGGSPHGSYKLKFNATALGALGSDGKLPVGGEFPKGSLIVKEVYKDGKLDIYAIMKKDPKSKYASHAWVWAEYKANGDVYYNVSKIGKDCISCHGQSPSRDLTRVFDLQ